MSDYTVIILVQPNILQCIEISMGLALLGAKGRHFLL